MQEWVNSEFQLRRWKLFLPNWLFHYIENLVEDFQFLKIVHKP
jgi:hypothetical protein